MLTYQKDLQFTTDYEKSFQCNYFRKMHYIYVL